MTARKGEAPAQSLEDVTDKIQTKCWVCKREQTILVLFTGLWTKTQNEMGVCENKDCYRFCDVKKLQTWRRKVIKW